ncbi:AAA family ATPase [Bradyrhizobium sp. IC3069]|uniref:AAA family ATPase n=1 Tax=unclassified Bradyrhizobium TaxID=2631580 RepID=UPI001CD6FA8D|nr:MULTISPECIES: AAA family ATPase [unclassified Bradyrhizobium]MCA1360457.1 AAA family ATPase [Bradyrhizobium sp. IC4059]MCA1516947.1 AAA family ATPase [Bradyrhizobium sp. IC3069]
MQFKFVIPTPSGEMQFDVSPGSSILFVGPNGGGKTRLAVKIEEQLGPQAHRVSAHRLLSLNPTIAKISEGDALRGLKFGVATPHGQIAHRPGSRWQQNAAVSPLNDYDYLIQALFAEQANTALKTHRNTRAGSRESALPTQFEKLVDIWDRLLPQRTLKITGDDIQVSSGTQAAYSASDMSDGERAVFYLIGQTLLAAEGSLIIFDEPELHIHRAIMSRLWDELEAARPDCAIVFISHDLEFVASRKGQKFVLRDYNPATGWAVEAVPEDAGFSEDITNLILGSRKPVLFVEGQGSSIDQAIYRACYFDWTIIPRGSCEEVIHAVVTMRANATLTRVTCSGIVDADAYDPSELEFMESKGIAVLPVSEIENILLLPSVLQAIAKAEGYAGTALQTKVSNILEELFAHARDVKNQTPIVVRYCRRRIDRTLKKIDLSDASDATALAADYAAKTDALDVAALAKLATDSIQSALATKNAPELLKWYDNKGILSIACKAKDTSKVLFEQWIVRALRNDMAPEVSAAIRAALPAIAAR